MNHAIILAAGRGIRLLGHDRPKGLLEIGGASLMARSVACLRGAGISQITVVTGYKHEEYTAAFGDSLRLVVNPDFATSSTLVSLLVGLGDEPCLLLESDLLYDASMLDAILAAPEDALLLSSATHAGDEVWVELDNGRLVTMSKNAALVGTPAGEFVGINRLSAAAVAWIKRYAAELSPDARAKACYETDALVALGRQRPVYGVLVDGALWGEIDDASHLQRVTQKVWPLISARATR